MMVRQHIVFHGWVQGVGFRYRARLAAEHTGATGWVRNEYDGTVTMEIQGTREQIDRTIAALRQARFVQIDSMDVKTIPVDPHEYTFRTEWV